MKTDNQQKAGDLQPILVPKRAWQHITTDLVTDLPESEGKTTIAIFVDRSMKMTHIVPCTKEVTATQCARLFVCNVFRLHGMPEVIISDWDPRFVSKIRTEVFFILGTGLKFSIAFHPQTDGQSEVTIRVLEDFLQLYLEHRPSAWVDQLPFAEFAANNAININTGYTPFYLDQDSHPRIPGNFLTRGLPKVSNQVAEDPLERMTTALRGSQSNLSTA